MAYVFLPVVFDVIVVVIWLVVVISFSIVS